MSDWEVGDDFCIYKTYQIRDRGRVAYLIATMDGSWIPGIYDSPETAMAAANGLDNEEIERLLSPIYRTDGEDRPVTMQDVNKALDKT